MTESTAWRRWSPWIIAAALAVITFGLYWPNLSHGFINFDDNAYVYENRQVIHGLSWPAVRWAWTSLEGANWHPLTWMSHQLDVSMYGVIPSAAWGHHLTSLLLHTLNTVLLFLVLRSATGRLWPSAGVAALFAWHPLHVESVAWIAERKDVLSGCFFFLTLAAYVYYSRRTESWSRYLLLCTALAAGLTAKPMLVTVPFVLLLWDYWPLDRWGGTPDSRTARSAWPLVREKLPLCALAAASSVVTFVAQRRGGAMESAQSLDLSRRLANASVAYGQYLANTFWPTKLAIFYPYPPDRTLARPEVWVALVLLIAVTVMVVLVAVRRGPARGYLPMGWLWYLGMLVPVIGIVQVGSQELADRYTYLPLVGIFVALVWSAADVFERVPGWRIALVPAAAVLLGACLIQSHVQIGYWSDMVTLYRHALEVTTDNHLAHSNLGGALMDQAVQQKNRALVDEAIKQYQAAIQINPGLGQPHNGLGMAYATLGEQGKAVAELRKSLEISPGREQILNNLAWLLATSSDPRVRQPDEAVRLAEEACQKTDYADPKMIDTLSAAYAAAGRFEEAVRSADRAIALFRSTGDEEEARRAQVRRKGFAERRLYIDAFLPER